MVSDLAFAVFIDRVSYDFSRSAAYRRRLLAELPDRKGWGHRQICPPEHPHAATGHCYDSHRCGCSDCRLASSRRMRERRARVTRDHTNKERA